MSATLAFRTALAASLLLTACSQKAGSPGSSLPDGQAGTPGQAGAASNSTGEGGAGAREGVGGAGSHGDPPVGQPAAGAADLGTAGAESSAGMPGSGGTPGGSGT